MSTRILVGDALDRLRELPDESVHCCITSPPYWGLRAYRGDPGMIGLEPTFEQHLERLVAVFREVRRVLRSDGCLWLNYGDAYTPQGAGGQGASGEMATRTVSRHRGGLRPRSGMKPKDLMMMPARVAMALQADGWWVRSEVVWHKPNPMPESVTDRPTSAHEKLFLFAKAPRYFYDAEAVRVTGPGANTHGPNATPNPDRQDEQTRTWNQGSAAGANLRNVWTIATHAYSAAHFATFPPALVEPCIKAGTSERGVCFECGAPWRRVVKSNYVRHRPSGGTTPRAELGNKHADETNWGSFGTNLRKRTETTGWATTCDCWTRQNNPFRPPTPEPATVLDPFGGAGTVGLVADRLGRDSILIEISHEYAAMAEKRIREDAPLLADVTVVARDVARDVLTVGGDKQVTAAVMLVSTSEMETLYRLIRSVRPAW